MHGITHNAEPIDGPQHKRHANASCSLAKATIVSVEEQLSVDMPADSKLLLDVADAAASLPNCVLKYLKEMQANQQLWIGPIGIDKWSLSRKPAALSHSETQPQVPSDWVVTPPPPPPSLSQVSFPSRKLIPPLAYTACGEL